MSIFDFSKHYFVFSKNYSKTYRGISDVRKGAESCSRFVEQLDSGPVKT